MFKENFDVKGSVFLLSNGILHKKDAKTSHGLIRGSERFKVKAIVDSYSAGKDAGELLDGINRNIPIYDSLNSAIEKEGKPDYCVVGVATKGGVLPEELMEVIKNALIKGISIISGLHYYLIDQPIIVELAEKYGAKLIVEPTSPTRR